MKMEFRFCDGSMLDEEDSSRLKIEIRDTHEKEEERDFKHAIIEFQSPAKTTVSSHNTFQLHAPQISFEPPQIPPIDSTKPPRQLSLPTKHFTTTMRTEKTNKKIDEIQDITLAHNLFDPMPESSIIFTNEPIQVFFPHDHHHLIFLMNLPPPRPPSQPSDTFPLHDSPLTQFLPAHSMAVPNGASNVFDKVYIPSLSSQRRRIPPAFVKNFKGTMPKKVILKDFTGKLWHVELEKVGKKLFMHNGWQDFVTDYSLEYGDFLIFSYSQNSIFNVRLFGKDGCRKESDSAIVKIATHVKEEEDPEAVQTDCRFPRACKRKSSQALRAQNIGVPPYLRKCKARMAAINVEKHKVLNAENFVMPKNPHFVALMSICNRYDVHIPSTVLKKYGINMKPDVVLRDAFGRRSLLVHWPTLEDPWFLLSSVSPKSSLVVNSDFEVENGISTVNFWEEFLCGVYSISINVSKWDKCLLGEIEIHDWTSPWLKELVKWERDSVELKSEDLCIFHCKNSRGQHNMQSICADQLPSKSGPLQASVLMPDPSVRNALKEFVRRRTTMSRIFQDGICDVKRAVPVAVFISGGLDSMSLAALLNECLKSSYEIDLLKVNFDGKSAPNRISTRVGVKELERISPLRRWRFVEIDVELLEFYFVTFTEHLRKPVCKSISSHVGKVLTAFLKGNGFTILWIYSLNATVGFIKPVLFRIQWIIAWSMTKW